MRAKIEDERKKEEQKRCERERKEKQKDREEEEIKMRAEIVDERNEYWKRIQRREPSKSRLAWKKRNTVFEVHSINCTALVFFFYP